LTIFEPPDIFDENSNIMEDPLNISEDTKTEKDLAIEVLSPHFLLLEQAIKNGFKKFLNISDRCHFTRRTQASVVHDLITREITILFEKIRHTHCYTQRSLFSISFSNRINLRVKKLDSTFKASNNPTVTSREFENRNEYQLFESAILLTIGYIANDTFTEIKSIPITYWNNNKLQWKLDIMNNNYSEKILPFAENEVPTNTHKDRIRQRNSLQGDAGGMKNEGKQNKSQNDYVS
jgi:hypothetical protein